MAALEEGEETICSGPGPGVLRLPTVEPETGTGGEDKDKGRGGGGRGSQQPSRGMGGASGRGLGGMFLKLEKLQGEGRTCRSRCARTHFSSPRWLGGSGRCLMCLWTIRVGSRARDERHGV